MIWPLAIFWLFLNFFDVFVSWLAVQFGASEVGLLYQLNSFWVASINKMVLALIIAGLLGWFKKQRWLIWLNIGMLLLVCWNVFILRALPNPK